MANSIRRREFIIALGGVAMAWPRSGCAQQGAIPVVGVLQGVSASAGAAPMAAFRRGLSETGFDEGRNLAIEYRWADNQADRLPALVADLVGRKVAVIHVGASDLAIRTVMAATKTIPIVFRTASDPVAAGFVASLNRPGGNATGNTNIGRELIPKRLELLHQAIPTAKRIAFLVNPNNPVISQDGIAAAQSAARRLGLEIIVLRAGTEAEIEAAFAAAVQQRAAAVDAGLDAYILSRRDQIALLALRHGLPAIAGAREAARAGLLMSYGTDNADMYRQAGVYVGRILKGEKPADLPVLQPTKFELVINLKTAEALGIKLPPAIHALADEVIE